MMKDGTSLTTPPDKAVTTGVSTAPLLPGFVPVFEEHEARLAAGYHLPEWEALEPAQRVLEMAHFRARRLVHMHEEDAVARAIEKRGKR